MVSCKFIFRYCVSGWMTAFYKPRLAPDYKGFFKITLLKNMYLFFHFIYFPKPLSSKLRSAWVPVTMTSHARSLFNSSTHCLRLTKVLAGSEARPAPTRVNSKGLSLQTFPLFKSMQTRSASPSWDFILLVNDIKYSNDTLWVKYWNQIGYKPNSETWTCLHLHCQGAQKESFFLTKEIINLWRCFFFLFLKTCLKTYHHVARMIRHAF